MRSSVEATFDLACSLLETVLTGEVRQDIAAELAQAGSLEIGLQRLRAGLRANVLHAGGRHIGLERIVNAYDRETRQEGFHVLHDWDGRADRVNEDSIPIDVLTYVMSVRAADAADRTVFAMLLDYYLVHLLALFSLRIWDEGDADANLDRLNDLLVELQGPNGSGQRFAADAETLMLIATSHFEVQERGYDRLLDRVRRLNVPHQTNIALGHASSMGCHLRFGFEATYGRDTIVMRHDNVADYPWLCYALLAVMRAYVRLRERGVAGAARDRVVEALLNGLSGDARAFVGEPPAFMARSEGDRAEFRDLFLRYRDELLADFERFRPTEHQYSPLSFFFNFSHNILKGTVVDALLRGDPWPLTFNDLLTGVVTDTGTEHPGQGREESPDAKELLATTLMTYARLNPDRIRGELKPVIVYDPLAGRQAFGTTMRRLRE
jgi:hypothetical protein